ncbi:MAG: YbhB/YbcL family Raf kinase inhibitor-like protein [Firmicutes bacterium]|nr:YbhB/YbcL family Raf kinase inhibitor-like protein [Bacillota bacterium]
MRKFIIGVCVFILVIIAFFTYKRITNIGDYVNPPVNLKISSEAFKEGGYIPVRFSGRGEDISPQLTIDKIDPKAKTIAIIMDDLDHPLGVYNHWVIWNIPAKYNVIPEGIPKKEVTPSLGNAIQGKSDYGGKHYYRGPKPPFGSHEYIFKVYVLDTALDINKDSGKVELQKAMDGHIIQYGTLKGKFGN